MSEAEKSDNKKGSKWPWILVPVAAVSLFFVLRYCQQRIPPAERPAAESAPGEPAPEYHKTIHQFEHHAQAITQRVGVAGAGGRQQEKSANDGAGQSGDDDEHCAQRDEQTVCRGTLHRGRVEARAQAPEVSLHL